THKQFTCHYSRLSLQQTSMEHFTEEATALKLFQDSCELHRCGLIHLAYNFFTGEDVGTGQVKLFLWGLELDFDGNKAKPCECLEEVRKELEKGIKRFLTEPD